MAEPYNWRQSKSDPHRIVATIESQAGDGPYSFVIAEVVPGQGGVAYKPEDSLKVARLIAVAPKLHAACQQYADAHTALEQLQAQQAIFAALDAAEDN